MGEFSKKGARWSEEEVSTARLMFRAGKRDTEIGEAIGRTPRAVAGFLRRERHGPSRANPTYGRDRHGNISKQGPAILEDQRQSIVQQDEAFCRAMEAAGYKRYVVTTPGTQSPKRIQPPAREWRSRVACGGTAWE